MTAEDKKMIPLSVIDAKIAELEIGNNYCYECGIDYQDYAREKLEQLKKEAIPSPSELQIEKPMHEQGLEQKINARIAELEAEEHSNYEYKAYQEGGLDELRKLLE